MNGKVTGEPLTWVSVTIGAVVSMTMFLLAPSEPAVPGTGRSRFASTVVAVLRIVPPFNASAVAEA